MTKKFEVQGSITLNLEIEGMDRHEVAEKFKALHPNATINSIGDDSLIGFCEISGKGIFGDDDYVTDSDGIMMLSRFIPESK